MLGTVECACDRKSRCGGDGASGGSSSSSGGGSSSCSSSSSSSTVVVDEKSTHFVCNLLTEEGCRRGRDSLRTMQSQFAL